MKAEEVFKMLDDIAKGIAMTFGRNCETLIQDYSKPNHPVLSIYNGHVSGREVGSSLEITSNASRYIQGVQITDHLINCLAMRNNRKIKTTSFNFRGEGYYYCLGINYDFTILAETQVVLESMNMVGEELDIMVDQNYLSQILDSILIQIGIPVEEMKKENRLEVIRLLKAQNAFSFQKSVPYVAERLKLSRYTIYSYIKELNSEESSKK
ncbi:MAG: helix-turn-helix transcriptional regulator [Chloroflexi bacterium]|nr:helix-turn-helix transcriptional regulator [Chloroflexota bacterium]